MSEDFFGRDVVIVAKDLLGKLLVSNVESKRTSGIIVETEAYKGPEDKACHAYNNLYTERTKIMYQKGGTAYITLCYGIHHLFNVVTSLEGAPQAVLIRAIEPIENIDLMLQRRGMNHLSTRLTAGPGVLTKALAITTDYHGLNTLSDNSPIWFETSSNDSFNIVSSPRVGIDYAEEWRSQPWRFRIANSKWTSPAKT